MCYDMPASHAGIPKVNGVLSHKSWSNPYIVVQYTGSQCENRCRATSKRLLKLYYAALSC